MRLHKAVSGCLLALPSSQPSFLVAVAGGVAPSYYRPGAFASYAAVPLLLSAAISAAALIRLSRLALLRRISEEFGGCDPLSRCPSVSDLCGRS